MSIPRPPAGLLFDYFDGTDDGVELAAVYSRCPASDTAAGGSKPTWS